mmetsp:Transcript_24872/g.50279  ORF Transcript_24872/g.50279 Transcript_24872/m.50279 type:complete len:115 (+) Transcript_24872:157-501(+)
MELERGKGPWAEAAETDAAGAATEAVPTETAVAAVAETLDSEEASWLERNDDDDEAGDVGEEDASSEPLASLLEWARSSKFKALLAFSLALLVEASFLVLFLIEASKEPPLSLL